MSNYRKSTNYVFLIIDLISLSLAYMLAIYITKKRLIMMPEIEFIIEANEVFLLFFFVFIWSVFANWSGLYNSFKIVSRINLYFVLLKSVFVQLIVSVILLFFLKSILFSRFFLFAYIISLIFLLIIGRIILNVVKVLFKGKGKFIRRIIIIGDNKSGSEFYKMIYDQQHSIYNILGVISDKKPEETYKKYLGTDKDLERILDNEEADDIIIALAESKNNELNSIIARCENYPVRVKIIPEYAQFFSKKFHITSFGSIPIISIQEDLLDNLYWRFIKRTFDIILSVFVFFFIFIWVCPFVIIMIKLSSKGPVFFKQERWGRKNKRIIVYKFRTMKIESSDIDSSGKYIQAIKNDPRITSIGSFLRKTNLDELPQILNVIIGNMSFVGPRPHPTPLNIESIRRVKSYMKRHLVKPGITGWAQVNGLRGETKKDGLMNKRVQYDIWYIENWSIWLDIQILFLTAWNMIKGESNAY